MFVPCPHCQFLVACPPQRRELLPANCPRCGRPLEAESAAAAPHAPVAADAGTGSAAAPPPSSAQAAMLRALGGGGTDATTAPATTAPATVADADADADDALLHPAPEAETDEDMERRAVGQAEADIDASPDAVAPAGAVDVETGMPGADTGAGDPVAHDAAVDQGPATEPEPVAESVAEAPAPASTPEPAPAAFAARRARGTAWTRLRWPLVALLALLLGLQMLLADRARLAADPGWRPLLETLCGTLGCTLPAWHEPGAFVMLDRQVRPAPQAGALRVDATFRNDARWAQDWPALQLALSDADGRVIGSQVFLPAEYLGAAPATQLSPGQSAQVSFLVQEPAPGTVAFSFEFR